MMTSTVAHPSVYSSAHLLLFLVRLQLLVSGCMDVFKGPLARHAESRTCGLNERRTGLPKPNNLIKVLYYLQMQRQTLQRRLGNPRLGPWR